MNRTDTFRKEVRQVLENNILNYRSSRTTS